MQFENKIGKSFDSLAQRMIYVYIATFPEFIPLASDQASKDSQKQMHDFLWSVITGLYEDPTLIDLPIQPDDCYENWMLNNRKPELITMMRKINKVLDSFYTLLIKIGEVGEIKDNRLYVDKSAVRISSKNLTWLGNIGLKNESNKTDTAFWSEEYPEMLPAWKLLSSVAIENPLDSVLLFSRGIFDASFNYSSGIYAVLSGNPVLFNEFQRFFEDNGYDYSIHDRGKPIVDNCASLEWHKEFNAKDGDGMKIRYDYRKVNQIVFELMIPRFRELLLQFEKMDDELKNLAVERTKKCDKCGYCIQTDKVNRKIIAFKAEYNGETYEMCPFFPAFIWNYIDEKTVSAMKKLLMFAEKEFQA